MIKCSFIEVTQVIFTYRLLTNETYDSTQILGEEKSYYVAEIRRADNIWWGTPVKIHYMENVGYIKIFI